MQNLKFPLQFKFRISTLTNDFVATDATGHTVAYVKQKLFKFKEDINVYNDTTQEKINYKIKADRWLDFSAAYSFYDENGKEFGKVVRKGWRSLWKAEYIIIDQFDKEQYKIKEENGWVKVIDSFISEIPIVGFFTGYIANPTYLLTDTQGQSIIRLKKDPSFFGRHFTLDKVGPMDNDDDDRIMLGIMMMILLERRRG